MADAAAGAAAPAAAPAAAAAAPAAGGELAATLSFEDFPGRSLEVLLFKDVSNSEQLRDAVQAGALTPEAALANAALVPDPLVLHAAAYKALAAQARGGLRTRSLHAELVFNLSGSKHIGETLGRYGIQPACRHVLAARFDATPAEAQQLAGLVQGTPAPLADLPSLADEALLTKYLKVTAHELAVGSLAEAQLGRIAARDC